MQKRLAGRTGGRGANPENAPGAKDGRLRRSAFMPLRSLRQRL
jgi:hypothetical protein